jgi:hypothetical protein
MKKIASWKYESTKVSMCDLILIKIVEASRV